MPASTRENVSRAMVSPRVTVQLQMMDSINNLLEINVNSQHPHGVKGNIVNPLRFVPMVEHVKPPWIPLARTFDILFAHGDD